MLIIIGENAKQNKDFDDLGYHTLHMPPVYYQASKCDMVSHFEKVIERANGDLNFAERGCVRAHWLAYKYILENDIESCVILEDDATHSKFGCSNRIKCAHQKFMASDYHIGIIGISRLNNTNIRYFNLKYSNILGNPKRDEFLDNQYLNYCGTVGYMIKREACEILLNIFEEPYWRADNWDAYRSLGLKVALYNPVLVIENMRQSEIGNSPKLMNSLFDKEGIMKELAHFLYIKIRTLLIK